MTTQRMDHVGIVVDDLAAATAFFVELGLELQGEGSVEGGWVDRVVGLEGVRSEIDLVDPGRVNIFERWESQSAVDAFRSSGPDDEQRPATRRCPWRSMTSVRPC